MVLRQCRSVASQLPGFWDDAVQGHVRQLRERRQQLEAASGSTANRELMHVRRLLDLADDLQQTADDLRQLQQLLAEDELQQAAQLEVDQLRQLQSLTEQTFFDELCDNNDATGWDDGDCDALLEVRSGAGGLEAMLFAEQLADMYRRYAANPGASRSAPWSISSLAESRAEQGGLRMCALNISGVGVYSRLRYEAGVHRVQRVPRTERSGRVHTSTVAVSVLPLSEDSLRDMHQLQLPASELRVDTMRAGGAGGQHVNTTDSAVRITHVPSGTVVECRTNRSQHHNRQEAMQKLRAKLFYDQQQRQQQQQTSTRKQQIGTMERSEKIRTYNVQQDRVTDHRLALSVFGVSDVLSGGAKLDQIIDQLCLSAKRQRIFSILELR